VHRFGRQARRTALHISFGLLAALSGAQTAKKPAEPPAAPIQIASVTPSATQAPLYGRIEIVVDLHATYANAFDPSQITVDAQMTLPDGSNVTQPGFFYQPFTRDLAGSDEQLKPAGPGQWRIRLALLEAGVTKVVVIAKDKTGTTQSQPIELTASAPTTRGFIKVSERDFRYFENSDNTPFFPIGATLVPKQGLIDIETWLPSLTTNGANTARLILAPQNTPFAIVTKASGADKIDLANAWRLDQAMDDMDKANIHSILCLNTFNEFRDRDFDPQWLNNPFHHDNGGPIYSDTEFWRSEAADKLYTAKLRYVAARYGAYANLIGYELFKDVDLVHLFDPDTIRPWIDKHAQFLKTIDPYQHLVTISYANAIGERSIDHLSNIDFVQTHVYDVPDLVPAVSLNQYRKAGYGKPHLVTEVAASRASDRSNDDTNGLQVHDPAWASITSGAAGVAMPWWWDTYVFPKRTVKRLAPVAAFVKDINWPSQNFRTTTASFVFQQTPTTTMYRDLVIENGPVSMGNTEYNLPRHVRIWPYGVQYGLPVSGILQGEKRHPSKFNPITFTMDIKHATQFDMVIGDVSGQGGANIQVKLDGEVVLGLDFADPNDLADPETITRYHGTHSLKIPAGHHELVVADVGNDWVMASYRFHDILPRKTPPLIATCLAGDTLAIGWIRHADRSWDRVENQKRPIIPCPPTIVKIPNLLPGGWKVDLYDTWAGKVIKSARITVGKDGNGIFNLPEIATDLAIKMTKLSAAKPVAKPK